MNNFTESVTFLITEVYKGKKRDGTDLFVSYRKKFPVEQVEFGEEVKPREAGSPAADEVLIHPILEY